MKMKSTMWLVILGLVFVTGVQGIATADDAAAQSAPTQSSGDTVPYYKKLGRGLLNIVSSPIEVIRNVHTTTQKETLLKGWTYGLLKGLGMGVVRLGYGAVDTLTFPFKWPDANRGPLMDPEYVWQNTDIKYV